MYPRVNYQFPIENDHLVGWLTWKQWWLSIAICVFTRGYPPASLLVALLREVMDLIELACRDLAKKCQKQKQQKDVGDEHGGWTFGKLTHTHYGKSPIFSR